MTTTNIKIKAAVRFPTSVTGDGGVVITKENGDWTVSLDFSNLVTVTTPDVGDKMLLNGATNRTILATAFQGTDATLTALAALDSSVGLLVQTGADAFAKRNLAAPAAGITVTNPAGTAGDVTLVLTNDLAALEGLASTGIAVRTATDTWAQRTLTGTAAEVTVTNGNGVSGNPTVSLPTALTLTGKTATGGTFASPTAITGLPDPTNPQDAATKNYVDLVAQGLDAKPSVKCATTANITLSGEQTIDGILTSTSRILVKNQSTASQNGIYVTAAGSWTRATDADAWTELPGAFAFVEQGTVNADTGWVCTVDTGGTIGSTSVTFVQFSGAGTYSAGTGLSLTGTQFSIDATVATSAKNLSFFAATTSAQLAALLSDETGTGAAVFANAPALTSPTVTTQSPGDNTTKAASTAFVAAALAATSGGAWTNTRLAKTAAYTVLNTDKTFTIALGGSAQYALTFGAASGYDANFAVYVVNEDSLAAKDIVLPSGKGNFRLYPYQSAVIYNSNNVWEVSGGYQRWRIPGSPNPIVVNVAASGGSDTNDGLDTSRSFATLAAAAAEVLKNYDLSGIGGAISIKMATGNYTLSSSDMLHYSGRNVGAQGGAAITVQGGSSTADATQLTVTGGDVFSVNTGAILWVQDLSVSTVTSGNCFTCDANSKIYLKNINFYACAGAHMSASANSIIEVTGAYSIRGAAAYHIKASNYGYVTNSFGATFNSLASAAFTAFVNVTSAKLEFSGTINLNAATITGQRYNISGLGVINTSSGGATYFPGNAGGTAGDQSQYF